MAVAGFLVYCPAGYLVVAARDVASLSSHSASLLLRRSGAPLDTRRILDNRRTAASYAAFRTRSAASRRDLLLGMDETAARRVFRSPARHRAAHQDRNAAVR